MSRIGKAPVAVPSGVTVSIGNDNVITVKGPKGELKQSIDRDIKVEVKDGQILITRPTDQIRHRALHGLSRALLANLVKGVSTPANSASQGLASLYLSGQERPACFNAATNNWPMFGELQKYNTGFNAAYERVQRNVRAECDCSFSIPTGLPTHESNKVLLFPNPSGGAVKLISPSPGIVSIYTTDGELIYRNDVKEDLLINEGTLRPGCYLVLLDGQTVSHSKLIILNNSR